jgi:hypothetical protein
MAIEQNKNRSQFIVSLKKISSWFFLFCLSIPVGFFVFLWLSKGSVYQWIFAGLVYFLITVLALFGVRWLIFRFIPSRLRSYSTYWIIGVISASLIAGVWLSLNIFIAIPPAQFNPFANPYLLKLAYRASIGITIGLALLFFSVLCGTSFPQKQQITSKNSILVSSIKFAIPIGFVWIIYLLAFYPGMMSADSMDQWGQVLSGRIIDHHPAFHTFLIWLLTRISLTPAIIAVAQIITLAFIAGLWFAFFEILGIRRWIIWAGAFIFAVTPINGTMVVTLWKDIPYSTAILGLTLIIARIVVTKGAWIAPLSAQIILGVTAALVLLLRHDGLVLGVGTIVLLVLAYPNKWKPWLIASFVCVFLYLGIRGPVYNWVGVQKPLTYTSSSLSLYSIAAYTRKGSETDRLVSSIQLTSPAWSCSIWTDITPVMIKTDVDQSISPVQILGNLIARIPNLLSYYMRCARSMEWIVWDPNGEVRNPSHAEVWIDQNPYGIQPDSKIPAMREWLSNWVVKTSYNPNLSWFYWRPAIYLYINFFLSIVLMIRNRDLRFGLLSAPILIQSITFSLILAEPNFRYHYAVYLVSLIMLPLFFSPPITKDKKVIESSIQPTVNPALSGNFDHDQSNQS